MGVARLGARETLRGEAAGPEGWPLRWGLGRRFLGGATWLLVGAGIGRAINLAGTIWVTRELTGPAFGRLTYLQTVVAFIVAIAVLGLNVAVTKAAALARAEDPARVGQLIGLTTRVVLVGSAVLAIAMTAARTPLARLLESPELADQVVLASLAIIAGAATAAITGALVGLEAFRTIAFVSTTRGVLAAALTVVGAVASGLEGAIAGWAAAECLAAVIGFVALARACRGAGVVLSTERPRRSWASLHPVAIPALASTIAVGFALVFGQRYLADRPTGFQEVAEFNLAYRWSLAVLFVPSTIAPVLLPILTNLRATGASGTFLRLLRSNLWLTAALTALPATALILLREPILGLSGGAYETGAVTFSILMVATIPTALNGTLSQTALSLDAVRAWLLSDLALAATVIISAWVLIPRAGSVGLAAAYGLGYALSCLLLIVPVARRAGEFKVDQPEVDG
ncbi:MAG TPA: oligosaccharide flippase family protein [Actinomycetota bacterium]|nr:oligosaccharide flippase family protein [Actinomycetota bacterium]